MEKEHLLNLLLVRFDYVDTIVTLDEAHLVHSGFITILKVQAQQGVIVF
jgi:hypothetical protein